ncbi:MAG: efflux RND transporter periplasmic adaptor subunit [Proteobacteria bacterium]|nr:efflux RND transporter periplasmic adaptor subunit [Pseudomonadota bacterium]
MKSLLVWLFVLGSLGGGGYYAYQKWPDKVAFWKAGSKADDAKKSARPTTALISARDISFAISAAGEITPAEQVSVRPEVGGRIDKLPVDIGDKVKKGSILFTLDDQDLQTEKAQRQIEIDGAKLQVTGAQLAVERLEINFKRTKDLYAAKLLAQEIYDNTKNDLDTAKNALDLSKNFLERAVKALQTVDDKLAKTKILAPFDCTILTRPVSVGQAVSGSSGVNSGTEVLIIADLSELIINAHVNQADVTRITANQQVQIEIEAIPGLKLPGRVDRIAPQATIKNGIKGFSTRMIVKNDEQSGVRPGMTANLTIPLQSADNVIAVPLAAVFTEQGDRFVYLKQEDKFVRTPILIGVTDYDYAEVTKGLQGGETVSLVTPVEELGKVQQAFGAAAKAGKSGGKAGDGKAGAKGGPEAGGKAGAKAGGGERRGP